MYHTMGWRNLQCFDALTSIMKSRSLSYISRWSAEVMIAKLYEFESHRCQLTPGLTVVGLLA